ncbi:MAG: Crp/Fnr family transcriptional regulator [Clostridia bacterium]|nr:Crp/Fnr family transcriptional regulator [Clostridia bacterium]
MNISELGKINIFMNMSDEDISDVLTALNYRVKTYSKDETVFFEGDRANSLGIVLSGSVRIEKIDHQGGCNIISMVSKGNTFAETYAIFPNVPLMIDVVAAEPCEVLFLSMSGLQNADISCRSWYPTLLLNMLKISSQKNIHLSMRTFHTSSKYSRDRIESYLSYQSMLHGSDEFDINLNRQQLADYLNLDRSALSGELSRMRKEGLLEFRKNHFKLLRKST